MNSVTDLFRDKGFLVLRNDEPLPPERLIALAETLAGGPDGLLMAERHCLDGTPIQVVSREGHFGDAELPWHNDWSYGRGDFHGTLLYNKMNAQAAPTWFCDMEKACAALPETLRVRLRTLRGVYLPPRRLTRNFLTLAERRHLRREPVTRPMIFAHPVTGREVLYFSPGTLCKTVDASGAEAALDLDALVEACEAFAWAQEWRDHDMVLYDNFRVMHRRESFCGDRNLWRIQFRLGVGPSKLRPSSARGEAGTSNGNGERVNAG
jgi:alpha-ketoglutarate-dependent taurine dioxygenase